MFKTIKNLKNKHKIVLTGGYWSGQLPLTNIKTANQPSTSSAWKIAPLHR